MDVHIHARSDVLNTGVERYFNYAVPDVDEVRLVAPMTFLVNDHSGMRIGIDLGDVTLYLHEQDGKRVLTVGFCWHHEWD